MGHTKNWISLLADMMTTNHKEKNYDRVNLRNTHTEIETETETDRQIYRHRECLNSVSMSDNHIINKSCTIKQTSKSLKIRLGKVYLYVKSMSTLLPRINHIVKNCKIRLTKAVNGLWKEIS